MRIRAGAFVLVALAVTAAAAHARTAAKSVTVHVPMPAVQQAEVLSFTVTLTGVKGTPHAPKVHVLNDSAFGNSSAVIAVGTPRKAHAKTTYDFTVMIRRFMSRRVAGSRTDGPTIGLNITYDFGTKFDVSRLQDNGCTGLAIWDKQFESGPTATVLNAVNGPETITLESIRPQSVQDSPPEEILDNVVALVWSTKHCPGSAEGDDAGTG
jgi:hypothetical protein